MKPMFDHEKLEVYQKTIEFVGVGHQMLEGIPKSSSLWSQFDRAMISIPLNIAEGNGKWSPRDRCRFFDIAHGSALECAAILDVCATKAYLTAVDASESKATLAEIVRMLIGLIKANDPDRQFGGYRKVHEDAEDYLGEED